MRWAPSGSGAPGPSSRPGNVHRGGRCHREGHGVGTKRTGTKLRVARVADNRCREGSDRNVRARACRSPVARLCGAVSALCAEEMSRMPGADAFFLGGATPRWGSNRSSPGGRGSRGWGEALARVANNWVLLEPRDVDVVWVPVPWHRNREKLILHRVQEFQGGVLGRVGERDAWISGLCGTIPNGPCVRRKELLQQEAKVKALLQPEGGGRRCA